jgi:ABC-type sugar transport system ATPase subunit
MSSQTPLAQLRGIVKRYPGVDALREVDFTLHAGEVHCLVGENGAGKSTLMRILSGAERPDAGTIAIGTVTSQGLTPSQGLALGIGAIYQELDLVPQLSVAENIFLGHELRTRWGTLDSVRMRRASLTLLERIGATIDPGLPVEQLATANRQLVQIAKALSRDSRVLILDEPGAVLSDHELRGLFAAIAQLKQQGIGIIYISHRLEEVLAIGDTVTVMRDGTRVHTGPAADLTVDKLIHLMVGRPLGEQFARAATSQDQVVLSVRNLSCRGHFAKVGFELRRGEILGLAGLVGAGRTALLNCLFGALPPDAGEIWLDGRRVVIGSPRQAVRLGLGLVPEERREMGLVLGRSVAENIALTTLDRGGGSPLLDRQKMQQTAARSVEQLRIKTPSTSQAVRTLSGGNQQKVVLAKWLVAGVRVLLLDEPTRGVDVGAKAEIYQLMRRLAGEGIAIVMASSELPEVIGMSDRILVMAGGCVTYEHRGGAISQDELLRYAVPQAADAAA